MLRSRKQRDLKRARLAPAGLLLAALAYLRLLILKRRLILKLLSARRVGYAFSKQLNLKRRVQNCGRYR